MRDFDLSKDDIYLGNILQNGKQTAKEIVAITRTKRTPVQVNIFFKYKVFRDVCEKWEENTVIIPGYYREVCEDVDGRRQCEDVWMPEKVTTDRICEKYEKMLQSVFKKIVFDFKSAAKLFGNKREVFHIEFKQQKISSGKFAMRGWLKDGDHKYEIYPRNFLHKYQTLYFTRR